MVETQLADDASVSGGASPRGQRAGGPHAPEGITTIGKVVVIEGEVKGGEDLVIDGEVDGTIELRQHALTVGPTGRVNAQFVSEVGRGSRQGEREHPGERVGAYRRHRLGRGCYLGSAVGHGRRGAVAGPRGHVGRVTWAGTNRGVRPFCSIPIKASLVDHRRHAGTGAGGSPRQPHSPPARSAIAGYDGRA